MSHDVEFIQTTCFMSQLAYVKNRKNTELQIVEQSFTSITRVHCALTQSLCIALQIVQQAKYWLTAFCTYIQTAWFENGDFGQDTPITITFVLYQFSIRLYFWFIPPRKLKLLCCKISYSVKSSTLQLRLRSLEASWP